MSGSLQSEKEQVSLQRPCFLILKDLHGLSISRVGQKRRPEAYHNGGLRIQREEGRGAAIAIDREMPWNAMLN